MEINENESCLSYTILLMFKGRSFRFRLKPISRYGSHISSILNLPILSRKENF